MNDDPVQQYLEEIRNLEPLPESKQEELFNIANHGDKLKSEYAKKSLIESYLRMVVEIADEYRSSGAAQLDLIQEGNLGLFRAIDKFGDRPISEFPSYARECIQKEITEWLNRRT